MAMDLGLKAIDLNNLGAHHLRNHNYDKAIAFFRNAVVKTKVVLQRSTSDTNPSPTELSGSEITLEAIMLSTDDDRDCCNNSPHYSFETDESLLCKSAIVIHRSNESTSLSPVQSVSLLSMSAIYNLAISHHLSGLRQRSREYLHKAKHYYEIAFQLMQKQHRSNEAVALPYMCVLNNLAAIHRLLGDTERSSMALNELLAVMQRANGRGHKLSETQWRVFWSNLLSLSLRDPTSAAAA